jgi:hypothetical protein
VSDAALISLLMPTRGRPALARRFLQSVLQTAACPSRIEVIIYADEDDTESHEISAAGLTTELIIGPHQSMGNYNRLCLERAQGSIIVLVNDDVVMRSDGWDDSIRQLDASVPDGIYLAYGNDGFKKQRLSTFPILSRRTCEVLQLPYHPAYQGAFIDYHLMDIFKRLQQAGHDRLMYLPDVMFEHLHYRTGKAAKDSTYSARGRFDDDMLFVGLARVRAASLALLVDAIAGAPARPARLPSFQPVSKPPNFPHAICLFTKTFLLDSELPAGWRFFMWWWFSARYIASRVS